MSTPIIAALGMSKAAQQRAKPIPIEVGLIVLLYRPNHEMGYPQDLIPYQLLLEAFFIGN
ncbi:hypothetical protein [Nitrosomonas cryotolerans]|uniref:hypothetical protein n=1 Tax=Nitrosomonas cryotolerans TaxID=44575 RepID=UPI000A4C69E0|nr:hypothetical protein [Nitrosomonas cryotolerans]